jgi:hypothetical protein
MAHAVPEVLERFLIDYNVGEFIFYISDIWPDNHTFLNNNQQSAQIQ